ncbi:hypothetical protein PR048_003154, partial [Dryococelus australis]
MIACSFHIGRSTVLKIVGEVCKEIWKFLQLLYLPAHLEETWHKTVAGFRELRGLPNYIGSIDRKLHLAVVDPYYKFIVVDIGSYRRHSNSVSSKKHAVYSTTSEEILDSLVLKYNTSKTPFKLTVHSRTYVPRIDDQALLPST